MPPRQRTAPPGAIYETAERFQSELDVGMDAAQDRMLAAWQVGYERSRLELQDVLDRISAAQAAGVEVSPAWLYQQERLANVTDTIEREMRAAMGEATRATTDAQAQAAALSAQGSGAMVAQAADVANLATSFVQANEANTRHLVGFLQDGSPLADLFQQLAMDTRIAAREALIQGLTLGKGPVWMARQLAAALDMPRHRAVTIMRTETMRTYRAVAAETYQANADVLEGWVWHAKLGPRTCAACLAMHGTVHPVTERLDGHPRCRCAMVPRTKSWEELGLDGLPDTRPPLEDGKAWLAAQPERTQRAILGPAKLKAWKAGRITLDDVVARTYSPSWGTMRRERSLIEIQQGRNANDMPGARPKSVPAPERFPVNGRAEWDRWAVGRDTRVGRVASQADIDTADAWVRGRREALASAEDFQRHATERLKAEQDRLKSYVPDAKERAKAARKDGGILQAKAVLKDADADVLRQRARLEEALAERANLASPGDLPAFTADNPLAGYGDRLVISDRSATTQQHLHDLEQHVPLSFHRAARDHMAGSNSGGFYVGDSAVPGLDDLGHLAGVQPRGWPPGQSWDNVPGAYNPTSRVCACGGGGKGHGSTSLALHEGGHAMDDAMRTALGRPGSASESSDFRAVYEQLPKGDLVPYYTEAANPTGYHSEAWAESFAGWTSASGQPEAAQLRAISKALTGRESHAEAMRPLLAYFRGLEQALDRR